MALKDEVKADAERIAQVWDTQGPTEAKAEFAALCKKLNLVQWQAVVLADLVHTYRKKD